MNRVPREDRRERTVTDDDHDTPQWRQGIMVMHGIGQQHPFDVLDSFAQGLRDTLKADGYRLVTVTHRRHEEGDAFDHSIVVQASRGSPKPPRRLEIYEYWWAGLTQGKASFLDVLRWVRATAVTPLQRFTFNIPLIRQLSEDKGTPFVWESLGELRRLCAVLVGLLAVAALAAWLAALSVPTAGALARFVGLAAQCVAAAQLRGGALAMLLQVVWAIVFAGGIVALISLLVSLPSQWREIRRLKRLLPEWSAAITGAALGAQWLARAVTQAPTYPTDDLGVETKARLMFFRNSLWMALVLVVGVTLVHLLGATPAIFVALYRDVRGVDPPTWWWMKTLVAPTALVVGAVVVKRVFVDYVGDIALYATADENSLFFATRAEILAQATQKLRWLLRQPEYDDVAVAGHSLGSVIAYDALSRLIVEGQAPNALLGAQGDGLHALATLFRSAGAPDRAAEGLLTQLRFALAAPTRASDDDIDGLGTRLIDEAKRLGIPHAAARVPAILQRLKATLAEPRRPQRVPVTPVTPPEIMAVSTLVTFGSPLDKILYFFRTKLEGYETIRAHILDELHGYRRRRALMAKSPPIADEPPFRPIDLDEHDPQVYWLNVYARLDPVSASLRFFSCDQNIRRPYWLPGACHMWYWHDPQFYREVMLALDLGHARNGGRWDATAETMTPL